MGNYPTKAQRQAQISTEQHGNFFYGRRYFVDKTRFWGYIRKPGKQWSSGKLAMINESRKRQPDRLPEYAPPGQRFGYDHNYEYKLNGFFSGEEVYDPNSNQVLPEFVLTGYTLRDKKPGWLFTPADHYDPKRLTLRPR